MDGIVRVLRFVNVFCAAIVVGGQVFVLLDAIPVKRRLGVRESVQLHQEMLHSQADNYLLPMSWASGLAGVFLILLRRDITRKSALFLGTCLAGYAGVSFVSERFNKPTNRRIVEWSLDAIPQDYPQIRARWDMIHRIRTAFGTVALTSSILSLFTRKR